MKNLCLLLVSFIVFEINAQSLNYDFSKLKLDPKIKFVVVSNDTVAYYKSNGEVNNQTGSNSGPVGANGLVQIIIDTITFIRPLTMNEINQVKRNEANIQFVKYDFKLTSDYLIQSSIIRERAIKNELYSKVIGFGLALVGGAIVANGIKSNNQDFLNLGSGLIISGGAASFIGWCVSIDLNLESNRVLRQCHLK